MNGYNVDFLDSSSIRLPCEIFPAIVVTARRAGQVAPAEPRSVGTVECGGLLRM